jgi:hypothetical protein
LDAIRLLLLLLLAQLLEFVTTEVDGNLIYIVLWRLEGLSTNEPISRSATRAIMLLIDVRDTGVELTGAAVGWLSSLVPHTQMHGLPL